MTFHRVEALASRHHVARHVVHRGAEWEDDFGARLEVLHPPAGFVPGTEPKANDNSVVLKLTKGAVSLLLTGDLEEAGLPTLLGQPSELASTVLKVPHHGSALGELGPQFFRAVHPQFALISVGRLHHLPSAETLDALAQIHAKTLLTVHEGAIRVRTDGRRLIVTTTRNAQR